MAIEVVKISVKDLKELRDLAIKTFDETFREFNTPENMQLYFDESLNEEVLTKELKTDGSTFFFVKLDGKLVGYLKVNVGSAQTDPMGDDAFQIERIYILKDYQRRGIGKILISKSIEMAKEMKKKNVWLGVWEHNKNALSFYSKMGFVKVGQHEFDLGTDHQIDYIFSKDV